MNANQYTDEQPDIGDWPNHTKTRDFRLRRMGWETYRAGFSIDDRPNMGAIDRASFEIGYRCARDRDRGLI